MSLERLLDRERRQSALLFLKRQARFMGLPLEAVLLGALANGAPSRTEVRDIDVPRR